MKRWAILTSHSPRKRQSTLRSSSNIDSAEMSVRRSSLRTTATAPTMRVTVALVLGLICALNYLASTDRASATGGRVSGLVWTQEQLPGTDARVIALTTDTSGALWAAGSVTDKTERRPALWHQTRSGWQPIPINKLTYYGGVSELFGVAVSAGRTVAVGQAFGGAHGNARTVSWLLSPQESGPALREQPASFELFNGVRQMTVHRVVALPNGSGFTIIGSRVNRNGRIGAASWWTPDGRDVALIDDDPALSADPKSATSGSDVAPWPGHGLVAIGERSYPASESIEVDAVVWTSADGRSWKRFTPEDPALGGAGEQRAQRVVSLGSGAVAGVFVAGVETAAVPDVESTRVVVWEWSEAVSRWTRTLVAAISADPDPLSVVTGIAIVGQDRWIAARMGTQLRLAVSQNRGPWRAVPMPGPLPTGPRSRIELCATADGSLYVALVGDGQPRLMKVKHT